LTDVDALLLLSFGGPEAPEQVMPFLRNVTRGRDIPDARLADVAAHYLHFGGASPINGINRALIGEIRALAAARGEDLPVY
jgi:ferrochelatase